LRNGGFVDPYWILLDTQSTVNLCNNRLLLSNIPKTTGLPLQCYCNGGYQDLTLTGTLDGYGDIWYHPNSLANILSMAHVSQIFLVQFDTAIEQAIFAWRSDGSKIKLIQSPKELYYHDVQWGKNQPMGPTAPITATVLAQAVGENKGNFTPDDGKRANLIH
jgi:hypothetical protein